MATYITRYCPRCNQILENFTRDYRAIGKPFVKCPNCGQIVKYDHISEWDTKGIRGKIVYLLIVLWTTILYAMLLPLLYLGYTALSGIEPNDENFILFYLIGFILMVVWSIYTTTKDIQESRERLKNPEYQNFIKEMGFKIYKA